ncbi:MAG: GNAT family N-acetyltransferase [Oscillospiraceae bacterium]|nr:GNAT family N-acetyltransferase [Oscillospiraceae bacterium]
MNNLIVRKATAADTEAVLDILNSATQKLLAKGVMQWEYPWDKNVVTDYIAKKEFYIALYNSIPRGCFGLKSYVPNRFVPEDTSGEYWYHLAVHPDYDKAGIGYMLCQWVQDYSRKTGITIYFDCWAGNNSLRNYYSFNGFEHIGDFPEEDYFVSAFRYR